MTVEILTCGHNPAENAPTPDALDAARAELHARISLFDRLVRDGRDVVACAEAALDTAVRERTRAIFELEQLRALNPDTELR